MESLNDMVVETGRWEGAGVGRPEREGQQVQVVVESKGVERPRSHGFPKSSRRPIAVRSGDVDVKRKKLH